MSRCTSQQLFNDGILRRCTLEQGHPDLHQDDPYAWTQTTRQPPSCLTCRHSEPAELTDLALECRRYPPTVHHHIEDGSPFMAFPQVYEGDWCGEYQPGQEATT